MEARDMRWTAGLLAVVCAISFGWAGEMPVVFQEDFEKEGALEKWEPMDEKAWKIAQEEGKDNKFLSMFKDSKYKTKVRSPINYGLIKDLVVGDFVMDLKMQSTTKDYGHRDLCLFFGHQDATHFYYVHMALKADPHAHSIFIVNGKPRVSIAKERTKGLVWGDGWHNVRLVRNVADGTIEVYFDDMAKPIMRAEDKTFTSGRVGVGSFDDTGNYDDIVIRGVKVEPEKK
jgi:hypothetical protein